MHESQLAKKLVVTLEAVTKEKGAIGVKSVKIRLGGVHGVDPDAFRELFSLFAQGTAGESAHLEIEEVPPKAKCQKCGLAFIPHNHHPLCPQCGSLEIEVEAEPDLQILELALVVPEKSR